MRIPLAPRPVHTLVLLVKHGLDDISKCLDQLVFEINDPGYFQLGEPVHPFPIKPDYPGFLYLKIASVLINTPGEIFDRDWPSSGV